MPWPLPACYVSAPHPGAKARRASRPSRGGRRRAPTPFACVPARPQAVPLAAPGARSRDQRPPRPWPKPVRSAVTFEGVGGRRGGGRASLGQAGLGGAHASSDARTAGRAPRPSLGRQWPPMEPGAPLPRGPHGGRQSTAGTVGQRAKRAARGGSGAGWEWPFPGSPILGRAAPTRGGKRCWAPASPGYAPSRCRTGSWGSVGSRSCPPLEWRFAGADCTARSRSLPQPLACERQASTAGPSAQPHLVPP